MANLRRHVRC